MTSVYASLHAIDMKTSPVAEQVGEVGEGEGGGSIESLGAGVWGAVPIRSCKQFIIKFNSVSNLTRSLF